MGLADGIGQLAFDAIVQRDGSEGSRGRSFARFEASFQLAWVGAALVPVVVRVPTWVACVTMAAATGSAAIAYVVGPPHAAAHHLGGRGGWRRRGGAGVAAPRGFYAAESPPVRGFDGSRRGSDRDRAAAGSVGLRRHRATARVRAVDDAPTPPLGTQPVAAGHRTGPDPSRGPRRRPAPQPATAAPVRVLVLADTHIRRGRARRLPDAVYDELARADVVLHAGDLVEGELLDELAGFAPVHAVLGNNDHDLRRPAARDRRRRCSPGCGWR